MTMKPFESKVWLSSPTMHGPELEYIKEAAALGTEVLIANARYSLREILAGDVRCTRVHIR